MENEILDYSEIRKEFGGLTDINGICQTRMEGNTFYIYHIEKKLFHKEIKKTDLMLICCCGVHKQTFIDILKAYNFKVKE